MMKMKAASTFSETQLHDLAGNSFSATVSLAVDLAVMFNVCYSPRQKTTAEISASLNVLLEEPGSDDHDDDNDVD